MKIFEVSKYKEPANPKEKFKSDLARELTVLHFPIWHGDKKDIKVYRTLAYYLTKSNKAPVFEHCDSESLWIWPKGHGYDRQAIQVIPEKDTEVWNADTFYICDMYEEQNFGENIPRSELAQAIKDVIIGQDVMVCDDIYTVDEYWDYLVNEANRKIEELEEDITEKEEQLADLDYMSKTYGIEENQVRDNYQTIINRSNKEIKELKTVLEEPALSPNLKASTNKPKVYVFTAQPADSHDNYVGYFAVMAYDKLEAERQISKNNEWFTRRSYTGQSKQPYYLLNTVELYKEFNTMKEFDDWRYKNDEYIFFI